jgi:hypothetical protein
VAEARGQFGKPGERERRPLEASTRGMVTDDTSVRVTVIYVV